MLRAPEQGAFVITPIPFGHPESRVESKQCYLLIRALQAQLYFLHQLGRGDRSGLWQYQKKLPSITSPKRAIHLAPVLSICSSEHCLEIARFRT